jgi:hypothetical protein
MMRLSKVIEVGGRKITVREFDAETVYALLEWLEQHGGGGLKAHELLAHKSDLFDLVGPCVEAQDGPPLDFDNMGFGALMDIVNGLQAVNQAFLTLLIRTGKVPLDGGDTASPSS